MDKFIHYVNQVLLLAHYKWLVEMFLSLQIVTRSPTFDPILLYF